MGGRLVPWLADWWFVCFVCVNLSFGVGEWWNMVHGAAPRMTRGQLFGDHGPASRGVWLGGLLAGWCKGRLDIGCPTYLHSDKPEDVSAQQ